MPTVFEDLRLPSGGTPIPAEVKVQLVGAQGRPVLGKMASTGESILGKDTLRSGAGINSAGVWSIELPGNSDILPAGTTWYVGRKVGCDLFESYLTVPVTGGPYEASTLEDDPLGTIAPSALSAHESRLDLHGGGIEVDFKTITTAVTVTGTSSGTFAAAVPGLQVTIPDLPRPVYLHARLPAIQPSGGPTEQIWGLWTPASTFVFLAMDSSQPAGLNTTTPRDTELFARLPAHSAGNYLVAGTGVGGNFTARLAASATAKASLWAVTA